MDRRQQKTRDAILKAFSKLIKEKRYSNITVQEIIDEANIGRSTFYAHFETKDELLRTLFTNIFNHVFADDLKSEMTHDFSRGNNDLENTLTHILHHLIDSEMNIVGILSSESGELFMNYFKDYLSEIFSQYLDEIKFNAPADFVLNHLVGGFSETVKWWIDNKTKYTPEETARYYTEVSCINRISNK